MPKKILRKEWTHKDGDNITERVFQALDWLAKKELRDRNRKDDICADDLPEARLRYYLGFDDEKDRTRFANLKTARSSTDIGILVALSSRGGVSVRWLLTGKGNMHEGHDAQILLEERLPEFVRDLADEAVRSTAGAINDHAWIFGLLRVSAQYVASIRQHPHAPAAQETLDSLLRWLSNTTRMGDDMAKFREEDKPQLDSSKQSPSMSLIVEQVLEALKAKGVAIEQNSSVRMRAKSKKTHVKRGKMKN